MMEILVPIAPGELVDKITILRLKSTRIDDANKLAHVRHELDLLDDLASTAIPNSPEVKALEDELQAINTDLWDIEDAIRAADARGDFGADFVALAQSVYRTNDRRAEVKKRINILLGSALVEEKSYVAYGGSA